MEEINDKEPYIVRLNLYKVSKIGKFIETTTFWRDFGLFPQDS